MKAQSRSYLQEEKVRQVRLIEMLGKRDALEEKVKLDEQEKK